MYNFFLRIFAKRKNEYFLFFFGAYPINIKVGINTILNADSKLRYVLSPGNIILKFDSTLSMSEIDKLLKKVFPDYLGCYLLFSANNKTYKKYTDKTFYNYLFNPETPQLTVKKSLNDLERFINIINNLREKFLEISVESQNMDEKIYDTKITEDDIDLILDKIKDHGMSSLTNKELIILKKYTKND